MSELSLVDRNRVQRAYRYITDQNGKIYSDNAPVLSSLTLVNQVVQVELQVSIERARAMVNVLERWGNYAAQGHRCTIKINTNQGSLTGEVLEAINQELEFRIASGRIPSADLGLMDEVTAFTDKAPQLDTPPDGKPKETGDGSGAWDALLAFAAKVGEDVYQLVKLILTGEYTYVNTLGTVQMRAGDRLCVFVQNVDDQAHIYIDEELVGARSIGEPGVWDYSDPLKPGKHMIMIVLSNSGRFDYSLFARFCRQSDFAPNGSKRPIMDLRRQGTDDLGGPKRIYYMKLEVN